MLEYLFEPTRFVNNSDQICLDCADESKYLYEPQRFVNDAGLHLLVTWAMSEYLFEPTRFVNFSDEDVVPIHTGV